MLLTHSKKGFIQSIVYIIDALKVPLSMHIKQQYIDYFSELKILSSDEVNECKADPEYDVIPYNEYLRRIRITFGNDSKELLLAVSAVVTPYLYFGAKEDSFAGV